MSDALDVAAWGVPAALSAIGGQRSPEVPRIVDTLESMQGHCRDLASVCSALAEGCSQYAQLLNECHSRAEHELASLVGQTVVIQGFGWGLAWISGGTSVAAAQAAEALRVSAVAAKVTAIIRDCRAGIDAIVAAGMASPIAVRVSAVLKELLATRVVLVATPEGVPGVVLMAKERAAVATAAEVSASSSLAERLGRAEVWRDGRLPERGGPPGGILVKRTPSGQISNYAVFDEQGLVLRRVDLLGREHNNIPVPHVQEYVRDVDPAGRVWQRKSIVRPATEGEVP